MQALESKFEAWAKFVRLSRYRESIYVIIGSFMDESFDKQPTGMFVVGGIMGKGVPIFELERRWEELLKTHNLKYFKASECQRGSGQFAQYVKDAANIADEEREKLDSISHDFLNLIAYPIKYDDPRLCVQGVGVKQDDFYDVIKDANARAVLGDSPYRLAYDFAMIQCAWAMKELDTGDTVSFVCDEHQQYSPLANEAYLHLKKTNPNAAAYMATFSSADDKNCTALQAADAAIFEVRRALNLSLGQWPGTELRKQFNILADAHSMFLITMSNKEQLTQIVANHKPGEPFKLDALMDLKINENIKLTLR